MGWAFRTLYQLYAFQVACSLSTGGHFVHRKTRRDMNTSGPYYRLYQAVITPGHFCSIVYWLKPRLILFTAGRLGRVRGRLGLAGRKH